MKTSILTTLIFTYIGPGMGGGLIAAIIGILTAFFLSIVAIIWYPFKRFLGFLKKAFNTKK